MSIEDIIRIAAIASGVSVFTWWYGRKSREKARKDREAFFKKSPEEREKDFKAFREVFGDTGARSHTKEQRDQ